MKHWAKQAVGVGLVMLAGGVGLTSCVVDDESTIFIRQVLVPTGSECTVTADPGGDSISSGLMDVMLANGYQAELLVGNQMVERGSEEQIKTETSRFVIEKAEVKIRGASVANAYTLNVSGFADPARGGSPGWGAVSVMLVDGATASALRQSLQNGGAPGRLVVSVRVKGHTLGGQEEESGWFDFPIDYCYGCLLYFPAAADDPAVPGQDCRQSGEAQRDLPCHLGQDDPVDCRDCHSAGLGDVCEPH